MDFGPETQATISQHSSLIIGQVLLFSVGNIQSNKELLIKQSIYTALVQ